MPTNRHVNDVGPGIDFNAIARTALGVGQLLETKHRNDLYQQNIERQEEQFRTTADLQRKKLLLDQQQEERQAAQFKTQTELKEQDLALERERQQQEQQRMKQMAAYRIIDKIEDFKKDPSIATNRLKQIDLTLAQGQIMETGLGVKVPLPSREEMIGGLEQTSAMVHALMSGDADLQRQALSSMMIANPKWAKEMAEDAKRAGELSVQMQEVATKVDRHKAELEKLNIQNGRIKLQENELTEHVGGIGRVIGITQDPRYKEHFAKMISFQKPEAREAYKRMHPEFAQQFDAELATDRANVAQMNLFLSTDIGAKHRAMADYQATHNGEAPAEKTEELAIYGIIQKARLAEAAWMDDPFDKEKFADMKRGHEALQIEAKVVGKKAQGINDARLRLAEEKFDVQKQTATKNAFGQQKFLEGITAGLGEDQAALNAIKETEKQYPDTPWDPTKMENPAKKGKLEVKLPHMGQEDATRNFRMIEGAEAVIEYTADIIDRIKENPAIIGKGAQLGTAFAGAAQQLRAIAAMDPNAAKFLNTKTRDNVEAMHEILVYQVAKTMDPSGALDLKVVEHAKESVGDISSWTTGPQQVLNKLEQTRTNAERSMRKAKRRIRMGTQGYLESEAPPEGGPAKDYKDMTEQELLQTILQERLQ